MQNSDRSDISKKVPVIFVISEGHSGSTVMDLIMDSHSQVCGIGEVSHYYQSVTHDGGMCTCKEPLLECSFWKSVMNGVDYRSLPLIWRNARDFLFRTNNYTYSQKGIKILDNAKYVSETKKLYQNVLKQSGKKIIFDSSKIPGRAELLVRSGEFNALFVHLVRNGKGTTYSNFKAGRSPFKYMRRWFVVNLKCEIIKKRNKIPTIVVRYEDFILSPKKVLNAILREYNLEFEEEMLAFRDKTHHQCAGNFNVRIHSTVQKLVLDEKWRLVFPLFYRVVFNVLFGWVNLYYLAQSKLQKYE